MTPLIELQQIRRTYTSHDVPTRALDGVDLRVHAGEYVAVAGPSGCGKSTMLAILGLLDAPDEGAYLLNGRAVSVLAAAERARVRNREIGFVFQAYNLIGDLTVRENVELPLVYRGMPAAERRARAEAALERVGMADRMEHLPGELSGGQQQRAAVARAIAGEPPLLLADEPTGNLDSANGEAVMELLAELHAEGTTVCLVTHDPRYAGHAHRTVRLFDGRVVSDEVRGNGREQGIGNRE
ncbi:MAG TPA: ABC transporter ATP-binding protein [Longimicrobium sp.]|jgi:putative ABC transport system ATP-binding protein|uniref:ABC transporter ATP-binding protein n=1 Tax=Longimicrobium sp. TaxID=2029185 RepID=UPI002EDA155D